MNRDLSIFFGLVGLFIGGFAVALVARLPLLMGAAILTFGAAGIALSGPIARAQRQLAEQKQAPARWKDMRPFSVRIWGIGVMIIGALWLLRLFA